MSKVFDNNMNYIKMLNLNLYKKILDTENDSVEVCFTKNKKKNIMKKFYRRKFFIHSNYDPKRQARYICEYAMKDKSDIIFLFGLGLAYEFKEMIKRDNSKRYFIVEPDTAIFKTLLQNVDIRFLFENKNVYFIQHDSYDDITSFFQRLLNEDRRIKIKFIALPSYMIIYKELVEKINEKIKEYFNIFKVNIRTNLSSHRAWYQANICNLKYLEETCPIEKLSEKFKNVPAIICAAGPSIEYDLETLKNIGDKAIITSAGTGISIMEKNKIKIHISSIVDVWNDEKDLFGKLEVNKDVPLLYAMNACYEVIELMHGSKFLMNMGNIDGLVSKQMNWKQFDPFSGPSIANVIAYNLSQLGCNPIIFLGQDLCYSRGKNYAESASTYEDLSGKLESNKVYIKMKNKNGEDVYTTSVFLAMRKSMEICIKMHSNTKYLNATKDGLKIEGAEDIDFTTYAEENLLNSPQYPIRDIIDRTFKNHIEQQDKKKIDSFIYEVGEDIKRIIEVCKDILEYLEESNREYDIVFKYISKKEDELLKVDFYREVFINSVLELDLVYSSLNKIERIKQKYAYVLDKAYIMENAYIYEVKGEN